jgi:hypothetical protein
MREVRSGPHADAAGAFDERGAATYVWCVEGSQHNEATWRRQNRHCFDFLWCGRKDDGMDDLPQEA